MNAIEFTSTIEDGMIRVPSQYRNAIGSVVKVIVFSHEGDIEAISTEKKWKQLRHCRVLFPIILTWTSCVPNVFLVNRA